MRRPKRGLRLLIRRQCTARDRAPSTGSHRKHGKTQLRVDEARRRLVKAVTRADQGDAGAVAASLALVMGMRANEIPQRRPRARGSR
jgi:hypothetical protein